MHTLSMCTRHFPFMRAGSNSNYNEIKIIIIILFLSLQNYDSESDSDDNNCDNSFSFEGKYNNYACEYLYMVSTLMCEGILMRCK